MSTTITVEEPVAVALLVLEEQAAARNLPLGRYLETLAKNSDRLLGTTRPSPHDLSLTEFTRWLVDVSRVMPDVPPLPADFSRADIYSDHD